MGHSYGHDVMSDNQFMTNCGYWTHDEAAILYTISKQVGGVWADIGSNAGWTSAHIAIAECEVDAVDPMYGDDGFHRRAVENMVRSVKLINQYSACYFAVADHSSLDGVVIDGDHDAPTPSTDAAGAVGCLKDKGVILFHDARGEPVKQAVRWLLNYFPEFKHRIYRTPHGVIACWRGEFEPPEHHHDPSIPPYGI